MPSVSSSQKRFMAMVLAAKRGKKPVSKAVGKAAKSMSAKSAKHFASKRKGLPEHMVMAEMKKRVKNKKV